MTLYILGNGYDLYKGLPTKYSDFANWVKKNHPNDYENITRMFGLDELWSEFENKAGNSYNTIVKEIDDEIESFGYNSDTYEEEWREDSDRSQVVNDYVENHMIDGVTLPWLMKEWIEMVLKTHTMKPIITNKNIINFNFTNYIQGQNVLPIHENISTGLSLQFGHSKELMLEKMWTNKHFSDFGHNYPDAKYIFNQLSKSPEVSIKSLKGYLHNKEIKKIIFFGFSFGDQDSQYFNNFKNDAEVDFYFHAKDNNEKLFKRVTNKFANVNFISHKEWKDLNGHIQSK